MQNIREILRNGLLTACSFKRGENTIEKVTTSHRIMYYMYSRFGYIQRNQRPCRIYGV